MTTNLFETTWDTKDNNNFFTRDLSEKSDVTVKTNKWVRSKSPVPKRGKIEKLSEIQNNAHEEGKAQSIHLLYLH